MLHGSHFLKQVHAVQRQLADLQEQHIFRSISDGAGALSVMIGTSVPFSSLKHNSSEQRSDQRAHHMATCRCTLGQW